VIEVRKLTKTEFYNLLVEADYSETRFISKIFEPYDFFQSYSIEQSGLVINKKVIYWGALVKLRDKYELWTVVNQNVKEQFTLYKETKKAIYGWLEKHSPIYATMYQGNEVNKRWVEKMKFKKDSEDERFITYVLNKEN
jgi:hypothetical protein